MKFIDFFAGIGGFRRGLEMAGHECVGFCEWDKFAAASYTAMHLATPEQLAFIETLPKSKRVKEILKSEYRTGEWYSNDVRSVNGGNCPKADCYCFGAPCQDFSVAGVRTGLDGNRSSLVAEIFRIVGEQTDRPEWLIYENVTGMLTSNSGWDYFAIISEMDRLGYDVEWRIFNSKDFGVPQNRERVYTVGHFRKYGSCKVLPEAGTDQKNNVSIKQIGRHDTETRKNSNVLRVYDSDGLAPTLATMQGGNRQPHIVEKLTYLEKRYKKFKDKNGYIPEFFEPYNAREIKEIHPTLSTRSYQDTGATGTILMKEEQHGTSGLKPNSVYCEKKQCYVVIRKLTPRECFRLQGWTDEYFDRAALINSDAQLYKQAGNGVTVNVVYEIGKRLAEIERGKI